jgi:hypothetical protein
MNRIIEPELLDELPPDDPLAVGSRRDLCRVNAWMRHHAIMAGALQGRLNGPAPKQITELGAGDGKFLLRVAQQLAAFGVPSRGGRDGRSRRTSPGRVNAELQTSVAWNEVKVTLLDRQKAVMPQTFNSFTSLGWHAEAVTADIFDWSQTGSPSEVIIANLFLHHFYDVSLAGLFRGIAARTRLFIALEPRRAHLPLLGARLLWAIGCNRVTRHDAAASVRAGFLDGELSALWPDRENWQLTEQFAGAFSHLFIARQIDEK